MRALLHFQFPKYRLERTRNFLIRSEHLQEPVYRFIVELVSYYIAKLRISKRAVNVKSFRKELWFNVPGRRAFINITPQVEECLRESGVVEGLVLVNAMHITASVFINDDESGLHQDYEMWLEQLAPHEPVSQYHHNKTGEDNADAHIKRQVMGREVVVAITRGKLDFGPWEQIFYGEFDGGRKKRVLVKIIGS
jgi:secondary thiamine-phosphate synthase enzyme